MLHQISTSDELKLTDISNVTRVLNTTAEEIYNCYGQIKLTQVLNNVSTKFVIQQLMRVLNQISKSDELILTDINNVTRVLNTIVEKIYNCYGQIKLTQVLKNVSTKFLIQ